MVQSSHVRFDPLDPRVIRDPYPLYRRFREEAPIHSGAPPFPSVRHCHYAFRHEDVLDVLRDPRLGRGRPGGDGHGPKEPRWVRRMGRRMVLFKDPPDHTRLRRLLAAAFTPEFVQGLEPRVQAVTHRLVDALPRDSGFDVVHGLAEPLPVMVIAAALGLPDDDSDQLRAWSRRLIGVTDPRGSGAPVQESARAAGELLRYLRDRVKERRAAPEDDLISRMLDVRLDGDRFEADEVVANAMLLLSAGHETTIGLLGNGLLALLDDPRQWRRLVEEPALVETAVDELLRYDSPIQMTFRFASESFCFSGHRVEAGEAVAAVLGAANRDPEVFEDPEELDLAREPNRHLGFGGGPHFCMGPTLARIEVGAALSALTERYPGLSLAGEAVRRETVAFRSLVSLPVYPGAPS